MKTNVTKPSVYTISNDTPAIIGDDKLDKDYITQCIGSFGRWQLKVCIIAVTPRFIAIWNLLSIILLAPPLEYTCVTVNNYTEDLLNSTCYSDCVKYEYSSSVFDETLSSKFGLICDDAWLISWSQTVLMFGVLLGAPMYGWVSDRYGRCNGMRSSMLLAVILMIAVPYSPNYWTFVGLRFLIGTSCGAVFAISAVYVQEVVGSDHREVAGFLSIIPDGIGEAILAVFAYFSSTWTTFLFEMWVLTVIIFFMTLLLPESPRWLVSKGQVDKAVDVLTVAAKWNNLDDTNNKDIISKTVEDLKIDEDTLDKLNYIDLFRTKELAVKSICIFIAFIACGGLYFGINQYVTSIGSNVYADIIMLGLIQVPISCSSLILNKLCPRRTSLIITFVGAGLSMLALTFISKGTWLCTIFGVAGLSSISISFAVIYIYLSELFPTPLRNMAFGFSTCGSKLGSMVSPFLVTLSPEWVPSVILAIVPLIASLFCLLLPETKGMKLKDTLND